MLRAMFFLGCCGVGVLLVCVFTVQRESRKIVALDELDHAQVAVVLGARVKSDGVPSDILADRLLVAIDVYHRGLVDALLLSGDDGQVEYDEVNAMRVFALDHGVAAEDIFLDHAGFDTYDSMARASSVFGVTSAILVTQEYHLPRALYLASAFGIDAQGVVADRQTYRGMARYKARELLADVKAVIDVALHIPPKYLGEPIDITGDGEVTWDEGK